MRLSFRARIGAIVGIAGLTFVFLICMEALLASRVERRLTEIREVFLPTLELGPRLAIELEHLRRGFQDSVAAQDQEALARTAVVKDRFLAVLEGAALVVPADRRSRLRKSTDDYYETALDVSRRMIGGETGLDLLKRMSDMHARQATLDALVDSATAFDRSRLVEAFSAVDHAQRTSGRVLLLISVTCLAVVGLLSAALSRSMLRSLRSLSDGLKRFGQGDLEAQIEVHTEDELAELAHEANQMASRIKVLVNELDSFSYSVAHDLRAPVRSILGFSTIVIEEHGPSIPAEALGCLKRVTAAGNQMGELIDGLLSLSRLARTDLQLAPVDLSSMCTDIILGLQEVQPERSVEVQIAKGIVVNGDRKLLHAALTNLMSNAWKFTSKREGAKIEFGFTDDPSRGKVHFVRDNGAGFDMNHAGKLFGTFQRLHSMSEFEGTGVGLATVRTIVRRHGGEIWAVGERDRGATFFFTLK